MGMYRMTPMVMIYALPQMMKQRFLNMNENLLVSLLVLQRGIFGFP